mmetsp:Transcript_41506/g.104686  ORF Transcript_41506/g.104686 Transcript_41506/m.104686 type:complete len:244 (-) Transcript_41506:55-786(-)|eukprot:CAMPEP_0174237502 /NCGR_PEP_ID=MMETSP0417-20130205/8403_1 /TAXON_ID=242541 /ORGANISM="Mayorella sp, Strain BSH-02190019" /LENGTH=243 /DNA_ID=CAMNT_0015316265 /DNA_START=141 /DNA_END=872 /DNA_ORIENTATION=-
MKFLDVPELAQMSRNLTHTSGGHKARTVIETYSCKPGSDKKLYRSIESAYSSLAQSPIYESSVLATSPFGPMSERPARRNFSFLVATLNAVFPDYDFQEVQVTTFRRISLSMAESRINTGLASALPAFSPDARTKFWTLLDQQIRLYDCEIYEFAPEPDADPFAEDGSRWSLKIFFLNSKLSRVLFFSTACFYRSGSHAGPSSLGEFRPTSLMDMDSSEEEDDYMSDEGEWQDASELDFAMDL